MADRESADKAQAAEAAKRAATEEEKAHAQAQAEYEKQVAAQEKAVEAERAAAEDASMSPGQAKLVSQTAAPNVGPQAPIPPAVPDPNREPLPGEAIVAAPEAGTGEPAEKETKTATMRGVTEKGETPSR